MVKIQLALKGALPGYHISDSANTRRRALRACVRDRNAARVKQRLNVLRIYRKHSRKLLRRASRIADQTRARALRHRARQNKRACHRLTSDMRYLDQRYGLGGTRAICR